MRSWCLLVLEKDSKNCWFIICSAVLVLVANQHNEYNPACGITALIGVFLKTNWHYNVMRIRLPLSQIVICLIVLGRQYSEFQGCIKCFWEWPKFELGRTLHVYFWDAPHNSFLSRYTCQVLHCAWEHVPAFPHFLHRWWILESRYFVFLRILFFLKLFTLL